MTGVSLWRLQCFVTLADELHFGHAAARLFVTQPALSLQIKQLEITLGTEVVRRGARVVLTEEGSRLLPYAQHVLDAADEFLHAAELGGRLHAA